MGIGWRVPRIGRPSRVVPGPTRPPRRPT